MYPTFIDYRIVDIVLNGIYSMADNSSVTVLGTADACFHRTVLNKNMRLQFLQMLSLFSEICTQLKHIPSGRLLNWFHICARWIGLFVYFNKMETHTSIPRVDYCQFARLCNKCML